MSYERVGNIRRAEGDRKGALAAYEMALAIGERLAAQDPGNTERQRGVSKGYEEIGDLRRAEGDRQGAHQAYEKALTIAKRLAAQHSGNLDIDRIERLLQLLEAP